MGCNYYYMPEDKYCDKCKHFCRGESLHIGKSSMGWTFSFRGYRKPWDEPRISTYREWLEVLDGGRIFDEYGKEMSLPEFMQMVRAKQSADNNSTLYTRKHHPDHADKCWLDDEGHSFDESEFS